MLKVSKRGNRKEEIEFFLKIRIKIWYTAAGLKAAVDRDSLPPGKKGEVLSLSLAVLLIRTALNRFSLKYQSLR